MPAAKRSSTHSPTFFASPAAFRAWLDQYGATTQELIVGFHKVGSGKPSITWPESVDEVLCVGWIDGVRKRIDDTAYQIRFTPRRRSSIWSSVNIARVIPTEKEGVDLVRKGRTELSQGDAALGHQREAAGDACTTAGAAH